MSESQNDKNQQSPNYYYPQGSSAYYPTSNTRQYPQYQQNAQYQQQLQQYPQHQQNPQYQQQFQQYPQYSYQQYQQPPQAQQTQGMLPMERSYIENILRLNKGKQATVYMTFEDGQQGNAQTFKGVIEAAGRDHLILSDPQSGKRYLLLMIYLNYVTFDEEINYEYPTPFAGGQMATYPPR